MNARPALGTRYEEKATRLLPAEKLGALGLHSPSVICRGGPPSAGMTKMWRNPSSVKPIRSDRKASWVTIFGGSTHFAPFGGVGIAIRNSFCGAGTIIVNAMDFPSGAHSISAGDAGSVEICGAAPSASIHRTQI